MSGRSRGRVVSQRRRGVSCSVDLVCISREAGSLVVLLQPGVRRTWRLPSATLGPSGALEAAVAALTRTVVGRDIAWRQQTVAVTAGSHPDGATVSVGYVVIVSSGTAAPPGAAWHRSGALPRSLATRHGAIVSAAVAHVRALADQSPVAFRLLPTTFTLGELQEVYELLLGRTLHKASFRRALSAARLVDPTDEWRSEGRGRPAQLFRYSPRRRPRATRTVRFDLLGG
jgi:8-oxo-dGTP diphosphatase